MKTRNTREKELEKSYYEYISGGNRSEIEDKLIEIQEDRGIELPIIIKDIIQRLKQYKDNNSIINKKKQKQLAKLQAKNTIEILYWRN